MENNFSGDKKEQGVSPLLAIEKKFIDKNIPKFPKWIEGYHLTLATIIWSIGVVVFGFLAKNNFNWLWLSSLIIFLQWFTDSFDGSLGKFRNTGIPRWGFYMDHFLDFIFLCSLMIGYSFLFSGTDKIFIFLLLAVFACFMVNSFLFFGATGKFRIVQFGAGPTEIRIWLILINIFIIFFGLDIINKALPILFLFALILLIIIVFKYQKEIWRMDMEEKIKNNLN